MQFASLANLVICSIINEIRYNLGLILTNLIKHAYRVLAGLLIPRTTIDTAAEMHRTLVMLADDNGFCIFVKLILTNFTLSAHPLSQVFRKTTI